MPFDCDPDEISFDADGGKFSDVRLESESPDSSLDIPTAAPTLLFPEPLKKKTPPIMRITINPIMPPKGINHLGGPCEYGVF